MNIHPVALRAIQWKFGEVKLSKAEETKLAVDFSNMLAAGTDGTWEKTGGFSISAHPIAAAVSIGPDPLSILDGVLRVLKSVGKLRPETVYRHFHQRGWTGSAMSIRKVMYRGVKDGVLKRVGNGVYAAV